ncbi:hypothetical protein ONE63_006627 [Megalurothrips usitatus]|uniref:RBR-type E3 ubiquitin transferase n=1 Tax=Megalurothrips usitatus TaxID=439358 RepID=A0AAV7XU02_9NEOP|nr:hypothetical protein ONE63_006627 [Megalurothrips usitatus]
MRGSRKEQQPRDVGVGGAGCGGVAPMGSQRKRGLSHFSLTRLLYSPLVPRRLNRNNSRSVKSNGRWCSVDKSTMTDGAASQDVERGEASLKSAPERDKVQRVDSQASAASASGAEQWPLGIVLCPLCLNEQPSQNFPELLTCSHRSCFDCFQKYLRVEISESRVNIACPECTAPMHPSDIRMILNDSVVFEKYEDFMVRRVLACDPDTRWCPAPDCSFAVIATGCASCPKIKCERDGCSSYFCYHCKAEWHPNQTCDAARFLRAPPKSTSTTLIHPRLRDEVKPCPRCQVLIGKMDDGSCNHMQCAVCGAEFCWLCMKEVTDLHFLSPSGCTFWGKKPWSKKKKILWQLGTLVGAPVGIGLIAGIAVPAMIIGLPVWVGKKIYTRYEFSNKHKRNLAIFGGVTATVSTVTSCFARPPSVSLLFPDPRGAPSAWSVGSPRCRRTRVRAGGLPCSLQAPRLLRPRRPRSAATPPPAEQRLHAVRHDALRCAALRCRPRPPAASRARRRSGCIYDSSPPPPGFIGGPCRGVASILRAPGGWRRRTDGAGQGCAGLCRAGRAPGLSTRLLE